MHKNIKTQIVLNLQTTASSAPPGESRWIWAARLIKVRKRWNRETDGCQTCITLTAMDATTCFRPHHSNSYIQSSVVCVFVCLLVTFVNYAKTLNWSRCRLQSRLAWTQWTIYYRRSRSSKGKGQFLGVVRSIEKHCESLLRCTQQKITASAWLLEPTALLPTGRCHNNFLQW